MPARAIACTSGSSVSNADFPVSGTVHAMNTAWRTRSPSSPIMSGIEQPASE